MSVNDALLSIRWAGITPGLYASRLGGDTIATSGSKQPWRDTMTIVLYGLATFAVIFGGGILGLLFGRVLPEEFRSDATQRIVQTATGMISLLAGLKPGDRRVLTRARAAWPSFCNLGDGVFAKHGLSIVGFRP